jgi:hypothetical protein
VELERGEIAVIIDRDCVGGAPSKVLVLTAPDKGPLRPIVDRAGSQEPDEFYAGTRVVIRRGLPAGAFGLVLRDYFARPEA